MISDALRRFMFELHDPRKLSAWTKRMKYFRFLRAIGGHANDVDVLLAKISVGDDPLMLLKKLEFEIPKNLEALVSGLECERLGDLLRKNNVQSRLFGKNVWWRFYDKALLLERPGSDRNTFSIAEEDINFITELENTIDTLGLEFIVPPSADARCFTSENYPEYFDTTRPETKS